MLAYSKKCKVCNTVRKDKAILQRIYKSKYYLPTGKESLERIAKDYVGLFSFAGLKNHARKHQFISAEDYNEAMLKKVDKRVQAKVVKDFIKAQDAVQGVINKGHERLEKGEITVSTGELLRASHIKINAEAKAKDQELALIEMIAHFASGAASANERVYVEPEPTA